MGSRSWKYHKETDPGHAQGLAWSSAISFQKQSKEYPTTITISTYVVSPRFVFFGKSGSWATFSLWILVDYNEGLCLSIRKLAFQFRE